MSYHILKLFIGLAELDAVRQFNEALNGDDPEATVKILQNPRAVFPTVEHEAAILYHEEFRNIRTEKQVNIQKF